jgi:hypothetical protein
MTPKEKAEELVDKFCDEIPMETSLNDSIKEVNRKMMADRKTSKQCALIAVDEICKVLDGFNYTPTQDYWKEVKQEINKL